MEKLAICGKIIDMSKIAEKSAAQFRDQLKRNGIILSDDQFDDLWKHVQKSIENEAKQEEIAAEKETEE